MSAFHNHEQSSNLLDAQTFEANRRGEITPAQQKLLNATADWKRIILLVVGMAILGGCCSLSLIPALFGSDDLSRDSIPILFIGGLFALPLLFIGFALWGQMKTAILLWRDIANRAIFQGQGQLTYNKYGYTFGMPDGTLRLPSHFVNDMLPGVTYQACYLEQSRILISASAYQSTPGLVQTTLNDILASVNGFSADDLNANRNGEVSPAQRRKLLPNIILGAGMIILSIVFALVVIVANIHNNGESIAAILCGVGIFSVIAVLGIALTYNAVLDMLSPRLQSIEGPVYKETHVINNGKTSQVEYYYILNKERFSVNYPAYTALIDGLEYRIYYLARAKKLISIEALKVAQNLS